MIVSDIALLEALPGKLAALSTAMVRVGVVGDDAPRQRPTTKAEREAASAYLQPWEIKQKTTSEETNASIGWVHEKGSVSRKIPRRSFLEDPLVLRGEEGLLAHDLDGLLAEHLGTESVTRDEVFERMGVAAEAVVDGAFASGGYGLWPQLSPRTISAKGNDNILRETEQLREAISHVTVSSNR